MQTARAAEATTAGLRVFGSFRASHDVDTPVGEDSNFVIKVGYHENGPLFSELKFYQRWKRSKKLDFLGIPAYWGSGLAEHNGTRYRFMAMDRLCSDLQKVCERNGSRLKIDTVLQLGRVLLDVLEYIHDNKYVHADVKAANLMLGHTDPDKTGSARAFCQTGSARAFRQTGAARAFRQTGSARAFRQTGSARAFRLP
ncbi:unnamed protein product [Coregonus sp. 'balchen']|nr:unnamed protein product [Coregonus sp. 'balchen']